MPDIDDPRPLYRRALDQTEAMIAQVRPDQLDLDTPCTDYDVRRLLGHIVAGLRRSETVARGGNALDVPMTVEDVADDGWLSAYREQRRTTEAAWSDDDLLDRQMQVPWGTVPGRGAVAGYVQEVTMHGWDLAKAVGLPTEMDQELGQVVLDMARRFVPPEPRAGRGGPVPFGPVVEVPPDAGVYAQLAGHLGRVP